MAEPIQYPVYPSYGACEHAFVHECCEKCVRWLIDERERLGAVLAKALDPNEVAQMSGPDGVLYPINSEGMRWVTDRWAEARNELALERAKAIRLRRTLDAALESE